MKFFIDKKQNALIMTVCVTVMLLGVAVAFIVPDSHWKLYWLFVMLSFPLLMFKQIISDRKTWISFDAQGVKAFRYGINYQFKWDEIRRVEYKPSTWFPLLKMVIIHGPGGQDVYIDRAMQNHKRIYRTLLEYIEEYAPADICVDQDLYEYVGKTKKN